MYQVPLIQPHTIIFIVMCGFLVLCGIMPRFCNSRFFNLRPGWAPASWQKVVISGLAAVFILYTLGQIDLAGLKATRGDPNKWNSDVRKGVAITMNQIAPTQTMWIAFAVVFLLEIRSS